MVSAIKGLSPELTGYLMSTFVAGRTDSKIRREIRRIRYCDFTSLYPAVCVLQGLWRFVIAKGVRHRDATREIQQFLGRVTVEDLRHPQTWRSLPCIVQVRAEKSVLPIRAQYGPKPGWRVAFNEFSQDKTDDLMWWTLADCIGSKIVTGAAPNIRRAIVFEPSQPRDGLKAIRLDASGPLFDPYKDDFFKAVIDLRTTYQDRAAQAKAHGDSGSHDRLRSAAQQLKIVANSMYGFFEELNVEERTEAVEHVIYSFRGGERISRWIGNVETPGPFFHPLLGTCIASAPHLILAIAEKLAEREGIDWMFCDTDSMAFAQPKDMDDAEFLRRVDNIRGWFAPLNPFDNVEDKDFFKLESVNFDSSGREQELYGLAIAPKSYCLFNLDSAGNPIIREGKQHGIGFLYPPYEEAKKAERACIKSTKLRCWQRDLWDLVVRAHLEGHPDMVDYGRLRNSNLPAAHRFSISTPKTERDCLPYNRGKAYRDRLRPGGFVVAFSPRSHREPRTLKLADGPAEEHLAASKRIRRKAAEMCEKATAEQAPYWNALRDFDNGKIVPDLHRDPVTLQWKVDDGFVLLPARLLGKARPSRDFSVRVFRGNLERITRAIRRTVSAKHITRRDVLEFFNAHERPPRTEDFVTAARAALLTRTEKISPLAPFEKDIRQAAARCFDGNTGRPVALSELKAYRELLATFHLRPQYKYTNGRYMDAGITGRRHVMPSVIEIIGKETRRLSAEDPTIYEGFSPTAYGSIPSLFVKAAVAKAGSIRALARAIGESQSHLTRVLNSDRPVTPALVDKIRRYMTGGID